jgi:hypothetical protein
LFFVDELPRTGATAQRLPVSSALLESHLRRLYSSAGSGACGNFFSARNSAENSNVQGRWDRALLIRTQRVPRSAAAPDTQHPAPSTQHPAEQQRQRQKTFQQKATKVTKVKQKSGAGLPSFVTFVAFCSNIEFWSSLAARSARWSPGRRAGPTAQRLPVSGAHPERASDVLCNPFSSGPCDGNCCFRERGVRTWTNPTAR